ncbi:MAG TPA: SlyX family protein [Candidatus Limnocylindria bacterium]|nr:SlyX family protein [Candidatus Limnocylindria bacterium]
MSESSERLERIESHLSHLERQYEELNQVVIEQGKLIARLQKETAKVSDSVGTMELERVRATNPKPPHYQ